MKENKGWIKIYPKITKWCWYDDINTRITFLHLLLTVNWEDKNWHGIVIKRGSRVFGRTKLAEEIGISEQSLRTSLTKLKSTSELTIKSYSKYSVVSINKYEEYQEVTSKPTNNQPATNQQLTTTKEYKNIRSKDIESSRLEEIAKKYKVSVKSVEDIYEELTLYCKSSGKTYKDYEATLMNWIRRKIGEGKLKQSLSEDEKLELEAKKLGFKND